MNFSKIFLIASTFILNATFSFSQIQSQHEVSKEKIKKEKSVNNSTFNSNPDLSMFFGLGFGDAFRTLKTKEGLFSKDLGTRKDEESILAFQAELGLKFKLKNQIYFTIANNFAQFGEAYTYKQNSDSLYQYTNKISTYAVPLGINYTKNGDWKFMAGLGIQPTVIVSQKHELTIENSQNVRETTTDKSKDDLNLFQMWSFVNVGAQLQMGKNVGFYLSPEFKYQLTNLYTDQYGLIQKPYYFVFKFGLTIGL